MERKVFLKPPVSPLLAKHYVEARLHTDKQGHPNLGRMLEARDTYVGKGNVAAPIYVLVDPAKPESGIGTRRGNQSPEAFAAFLEEGK